MTDGDIADHYIQKEMYCTDELRHSSFIAEGD